MSAGDQCTQYFTELASEAVQGAGCCLVGVRLAGRGAVSGRAVRFARWRACGGGRGRVMAESSFVGSHRRGSGRGHLGGWGSMLAW
eukprot:11390207-Alexandrium_andersonii.AAC.1